MNYSKLDRIHKFYDDLNAQNDILDKNTLYAESEHKFVTIGNKNKEYGAYLSLIFIESLATYKKLNLIRVSRSTLVKQNQTTLINGQGEKFGDYDDYDDCYVKVKDVSKTFKVSARRVYNIKNLLSHKSQGLNNEI